MRLQPRTPVAADLGWCRAAGLAHPLHQLNGRRRADREATGRLPDRTTTFDGPHEPLTEVLGQGSGHNEPRCSRPQLPGIRTSDSMQLQTALAGFHHSSTDLDSKAHIVVMQLAPGELVCSQAADFAG